MPNGYRSKIGAVGLAVAILLASITAYWLVDSATTKQSSYENAAKNRANGYAKRRDIIEKDRCLPLPSKEEAACINEEREAARQGYRDEYDLEAQRVTANWTEHMGIAAIIGMAASLIGVGLVFVTFRAASQANYYTKLQMVPRFNIRDFSVSVSNPFHRVQTRPSITFSGPTAPDLIRVKAITRLYGEDGSVLYEWSDNRWQKADDWFDIIPFTTEILLAGEFREVTQDVIAAVSADAQITVSFVDVFGDSHSSTQKFKGVRSGQAVGIDLNRVLHE